MSALPVTSLEQWREWFPFDDEPQPASADGYGAAPTLLRPDPLLAELQRLQEENARLRADLERSKRLHSTVMQALANPGLKSEGWTIIRAVLAAEAAWAALPEDQRPEDCFVRVSFGAITHAAEGVASRSRDSASQHLSRAAAWGLVEREIRVASRLERVAGWLLGWDG